jgi:hypothetical protein
MKIGIGFFGLPRCMAKTLPSIQAVLLEPAARLGSVCVRYHLYEQSHVVNARSKEDGAMAHSNYDAFAAWGGQLQSPEGVAESLGLEEIKRHGDFWNDDGRSLRNLLLQLHSLDQVTRQLRTEDPDIVVFVNGLPVAVIELKNAAAENATIWSAFQQLQTYKHELPALFVFSEVLLISDGLEARIGTVSADRERFAPWRTTDGEDLAPATMSQLEVLITGVFTPRRFLDLLRYFIVFENDGESVIKKVAGYHQFHAVARAVEATVAASRPEGTRSNSSLSCHSCTPRPGGPPGRRPPVWPVRCTRPADRGSSPGGRRRRAPAPRWRPGRRGWRSRPHHFRPWPRPGPPGPPPRRRGRSRRP